MDADSLRHFRLTLKERRDALQVRLVTAKSSAETASGSELKDESDRANAASSTDLSILQRNQADSMLKAINEALDRIDTGDYGLCLNCEQQLPTKRLEALPWARFCITCQELIDGSESH
jgi:DnaK suppressor protein